MSQYIARYIEIVGKDNLKKHLKENLKAELNKAVVDDNWQLVKEVTKLIEIVFNENNPEDEHYLTRCIEIIGISKLNFKLKNLLNTNIESEQWYSAKEIAKVLDNYLAFDNTSGASWINIKNGLKNILYESVNKENWYLTECIIDIMKNNFFHQDKCIYIINEHNIKSSFKKILHEVIEINNYSLVVEIITLIKENLIRYMQQIEKIRKYSKEEIRKTSKRIPNLLYRSV